MSKIKDEQSDIKKLTERQKSPKRDGDGLITTLHVASWIESQKIQKTSKSKWNPNCVKNILKVTKKFLEYFSFAKEYGKSFECSQFSIRFHVVLGIYSKSKEAKTSDKAIGDYFTVPGQREDTFK